MRSRTFTATVARATAAMLGWIAATTLLVTDGAPPGSVASRGPRPEVEPPSLSIAADPGPSVPGGAFFAPPPTAPLACSPRPYRVRDINTVPLPDTEGASDPYFLERVGDFVFFSARSPQLTGLWRSDGTAAGTVLVARVEAYDLTEVNGTLFFVGNDGVHGPEPWQSDGTPEGTVQIADLVPGPDGSNPTSLTDVGGTLFFSADGSSDENELWKSDGTPEGTVLVRTFLAPAQSLTAVGGTLYFTATGSVDQGRELWRSDGTAAGTVLVEDIRLGGASAFDSSRNPWLVAVGGLLYFAADDGSTGIELWKSDGTAAGTTLVRDIRSNGGSLPEWTTDVDGTLYFSAFDGVNGKELWTSDGTFAGTALVENIRPGSAGALDPATAAAPIAHDGTLYFVADDGVTGQELWKSDGTPDGTVMVKDIHPTSYSRPTWLTVVDDTLFFVAADRDHGQELWRSDGSSAGTFLVRDIRPGLVGSFPAWLTALDGALLFAADDGAAGRELWIRDGAGQTRQVEDLWPANVSSGLRRFTSSNGRLFFSAADPVHGEEPWTSDGTPEGTVLLQDIASQTHSSEPSDFTELGGVVLFAASEPAFARELWRSDGTPAGTVLVEDIAPDGTSFLTGLTLIDDAVYFSAEASPSGGLWKSDGTADGTVLVRDGFYGDIGLGRPSVEDLTAAGDTGYFTADDGVHGQELWKTDGTTAGTVLVRDILAGVNPANPEWLTYFDDTLFFVADDGVSGEELWKTDGTFGGTVRVKDIAPGGFPSAPRYLTGASGTLFFAAADSVAARELWKSDGSAAGTVRVKDVAPGLDSSNPHLLTDVGGTVFFVAHDGVHGYELWKSDGTADGTVLVADIFPGIASSLPAQLTAVDGVLYFTADDGTHGPELWKSDGTPEGTVIVTDLAPGLAGSQPEWLTLVGSRLFFSADSSAAGDAADRELWALDVSSAACGDEEDFEGEGHADVLWRHASTGQVGAWLMHGTDVVGWSFMPTEPPVSGWEIQAVGDFDGDGDADVLWRNLDTGQTGAWRMDGTAVVGWLVLPTETPTSGWQIEAAGDFDRESSTDILWRNTVTGEVGLWLMNGAAVVAWVQLPTEPPDSGWSIEGVGDFDRDGDPDVLWRHAETGQVGAWILEGTDVVGWATIATEPPDSGWEIEAVLDLTADGGAEVVWRNAVTGEVGTWLLEGTTVTGWAWLPTEPKASGWEIQGPR